MHRVNMQETVKHCKTKKHRVSRDTNALKYDPMLECNVQKYCESDFLHIQKHLMIFIIQPYTKCSLYFRLPVVSHQKLIS